MVQEQRQRLPQLRYRLRGVSSSKLSVCRDCGSIMKYARGSEDRNIRYIARADSCSHDLEC
jgi:hypothetical protein